jgi:hypothetical protein
LRSARGSASTARFIHVHEFNGKISVMKFSPIRAASRFGEPWQALARHPSTTLSTAIVDKRKTANGSLAYPAFLQIVATSRAN